MNLSSISRNRVDETREERALELYELRAWEREPLGETDLILFKPIYIYINIQKLYWHSKQIQESKSCTAQI